MTDIDATHAKGPTNDPPLGKVDLKPLPPLYKRATPANGVVIPGDVGTAALNRSMQDQLRKTRVGISTIQSEIDADTNLMNELWQRIQKNHETLVDLKRSETMISAAIAEGSRPAFQR